MNQSAFESLPIRGMKYWSICSVDNCSQILLSDSTACNLLASWVRRNAIWQADFVSDEELLDSSEVLERGEQHVSVLWTTNVLDETTELVAQGGQDLIFVLDRFFCEVSDCFCRRTGHRRRGVVPSRKGMSSSLVRSGPRARAMVDRRRMAFSLSRTSSCWKARQKWTYEDGKTRVGGP